MKIIIFGATGGTGQQLVQQALAAGHEVTAFVRTPTKLTVSNTRLHVVQGNVLDAAAVTAALAGQDAVASALGSNKGEQMGDVTTGVRNIIAGMEQQGVRRLVFQSALGVAESRPQAGFVFGRIIMPLMMKEAYAQKGLQEAAIKASSLDWVIVRPSRLTDAPFKQRPAILTKTAGLSAKSSRAEVASLMLEQLTDRSHVRQALALG